MPKHDKLCLFYGKPEGKHCFYCGMIESVRLDERERIAQAQERRAEVLLTNSDLSWAYCAKQLAKDLPQIARGNDS